MRIGILSRNRKLYSTRRLLQAARARQHDPVIIDTMSVAIELSSLDLAQARIKIIQSAPIPHAVYLRPVEAVIPRIGASITWYGLAVVRQLTALGVRTSATAEAVAISRDKVHSLQIMAQAGLPVPKTAVISQPEGLFSAIQAVNGLPVVLKASRGTQGQEVALAHNLTTARAAFLRLRRTEQQVLVQEFIAEAEAKDIRVIVVGNKCVAAMERTAVSGEFRSNLHRGGTAVSYPLSPETRKLALSAAKAHGLSVAGVDILQSHRGPLLLEVNSSPGLEGIERATKVDVAGHIIRFLEEPEPKKTKRSKSKKRKRRR